MSSIFRRKFIVDKYVKKAFIPGPDNIDYRLEREFDISLTSKKGHVTKQGAKRKNWKKRWMVLHDDTLSYFKSENDSYPAGSVKIEVDSLVMFVDEGQIGKKNCFAIVTKNRNYYMYCELEEEVCDWIYALRASVYYANLKKVYNDPRNFLRGDQSKRVEKKGSLKKQGGSFKSIKTRYFVLKDSALSYYKSEKEMEPIDSIDLKGTRVEQTKNTKCGITLHTVGRQYFFLAESEKDREEWIDAINNVTKVLNEGELIQKKSIAIHQLILNKIKEAKKEKANDVLSEQVSPHSPMMWKSLSFHRCRNQFLDKLALNPLDGNIDPVERCKNSFSDGKVTLTKVASVPRTDDDISKRISLMNPEAIKPLQLSLIKTEEETNSSKLSLISTSPISSKNSFNNTSQSSMTDSPASIPEDTVKIADIKLDKEKKKKAKKDQLILENEPEQDGTHAMEIMIKDSLTLKRSLTPRESDDLDDLDDLVNNDNLKLSYDNDEDDVISEEDEAEPARPSVASSTKSSRRILDSDSENSDCEDINVSHSNVKVTPSKSSNPSNKIILKTEDSESGTDNDSDNDSDDTVGMTFSVRPSTETQTTPVSTDKSLNRIKTRNTLKRSDKPKKKKKHQTTFRRMHTLMEEQLQLIGIDVE